MSAVVPSAFSRLWATTTGDRSRQVFTCVAAAAQVLLPIFYGPQFDPDDEPPDVIQPAAYTFAVWLPIFAAGIGYAGYQARGSVRSQQVWRAAGWPLAGAFAATGAWAPLARSKRLWSAQLALAAIGTLAETGRRRLARAELEERLSTNQVVAAAPLAGMLAAWGQAACGVNLAAMLVAKGLVPPGPKADAAGAVLLAALGALGAGAAAGPDRTSVATRSYTGTLIWAFTGIVVGQRRRARSAVVVATGAIIAILTAMARRPASFQIAA